MKTIFSILAAMLISLSAFAQSEHLTFKGFPIDGTLEEYVACLKSAEFRIIELKKGEARLLGDFAGYKDCKVSVYSILPRNLVNEITVWFPYCSSWSAVEENYNELKQMMSKKYGTPSQEISDFEGCHYSAETTIIGSLFKKEIIYNCTFETSKGTIYMWIEADSRSDAAVKMIYTDKINTATVKADAYNDL